MNSACVPISALLVSLRRLNRGISAGWYEKRPDLSHVLPHLQSHKGWRAGCDHDANQKSLACSSKTVELVYPLVNSHIAMENHHAINGKIHYKWPFSIVMLVHQRVYHQRPGISQSLILPSLPDSTMKLEAQPKLEKRTVGGFGPRSKSYPLVMTNKKLLKMTIEFVDFPIKN